jgi:hypothetical protein
MYRSKILVFLLALIITTGFGSALTDSVTITYFEDSAEIKITSDEGPLNPERAYVDVCGENPAFEKTDGSSGPGSVMSYPISLTFKQSDKPSQNSPCGIGGHNARVYVEDTDGNEQKIGEVTLNVEPNGMAANRGKYLYIRANMKGNGEFNSHNLFLSDDYTYDSSNIYQGGFYIQEVDGTSAGTCTATYNATNGTPYQSIGELDSGKVTASGCGSSDDSYLPDDVKSKIFGGGSRERIKHPDTGEYGTSLHEIPANTWSPLHVKGRYDLQGELIRGYEPDTDAADGFSGSGPYWFVCREGSDGKAVSTDSSMYRCDTKTSDNGWRTSEVNNWVPVGECGDGLDNDGDGGIDLDNPDGQSDTDCGSTADTEAPSTCSPRVGRLASDYEDPDNGVKYSEGTKVAFHDSSDTKFSDSTSTCAYNNFDPHVDYTGEPPELFTCNELLTGAQDYSSTDLEDSGNAVDQGGADYFCDSLTNYHSNSEMKAVEYFVPKSKIPTGVNKYSTTTGFKNNFYQSLHDAESKYAETNDLHDNDSYIPLGMANLGDGYDETSWKDHWIVGNASAQNNEIGSTDGTTIQNSVFEGGFAPKCSGQRRWRYTSDKGWECSGAPQVEQTVLVPDVNGDKATIGLVIMPYFMMEDTPVKISRDIQSAELTNVDSSIRDNYGSYTSKVAEDVLGVDDAEAESDYSINSVTVACWMDGITESDVGQADSVGEKWFNQTMSIGSIDEKPIAVFGDVKTGSTDKYRCKWHYDTDAQKVSNVGGLTRLSDLSRDAGKTSDGKFRSLFDYFKNSRFSGDGTNEGEGLQQLYTGTGLRKKAQENNWNYKAAN